MYQAIPRRGICCTLAYKPHIWQQKLCPVAPYCRAYDKHQINGQLIRRPKLNHSYPISARKCFKFRKSTDCILCEIMVESLAMTKTERRKKGREGYHRSMDLMRKYKEDHPCAKCGKKYPAAMMKFKKRGAVSISRLAGSRYAADVLIKEMDKCTLVCLACA